MQYFLLKDCKRHYKSAENKSSSPGRRVPDNEERQSHEFAADRKISERVAQNVKQFLAPTSCHCIIMQPLSKRWYAWKEASVARDGYGRVPSWRSEENFPFAIWEGDFALFINSNYILLYFFFFHARLVESVEQNCRRAQAFLVGGRRRWQLDRHGGRCQMDSGPEGPDGHRWVGGWRPHRQRRWPCHYQDRERDRYQWCCTYSCLPLFLRARTCDPSGRERALICMRDFARVLDWSVSSFSTLIRRRATPRQLRRSKHANTTRPAPGPGREIASGLLIKGRYT